MLMESYHVFVWHTFSGRTQLQQNGSLQDHRLEICFNPPKKVSYYDNPGKKTWKPIQLFACKHKCAKMGTHTSPEGGIYYASFPWRVKKATFLCRQPDAVISFVASQSQAKRSSRHRINSPVSSSPCVSSCLSREANVETCQTSKVRSN